MNGTVNPNGNSLNARFQYTTDPDSWAAATNTRGQSFSGTSSNPLHASVSSLTSGTTYYYRVVAQVGTDEYYSSGMSFATPVVIQAPQAVSVIPNSGSGLSQTFSFAFQDASGVANILWTNTLINATQTYGNGCGTWYDQTTNRIYLQNNAGNAWMGPPEHAVLCGSLYGETVFLIFLA